MANKCEKCGSEDNYNYALNIGLCNSCIGAKLEAMETELKRLQYLTSSHEDFDSIERALNS